MIDPSEISDILKQQLDGLKGKAQFEEVGTVLNVGDGVAHVYGLDNVEANELVVFDNGATGVAMNLEESNVGVVLLDKVNEVTENMSVRRTGEIASIPVGEGLLGRVINVLGEPVDIRGFHLRAVVAFQVSISQVIRVDEQYVWRSRCNVLSLLGFCDTGCKKRGTDPYDKC